MHIKRSEDWKPSQYLAPAALILVVGAFVVALWRAPWWLDHQYLKAGLTPAEATTVSGLRTALVALGAGILAVAGLFYTHHTLQQTRIRDRSEAKLAQSGQFTDRFGKAIGQMASDKPVEQLGGIYALERIMWDSPEDHSTIVEVLAAFVRGQSPAPEESAAFEQTLEQATGSSRRPARLLPASLSRLFRTVSPITSRTDPALSDFMPLPIWHTITEPVQAALTVLGRRPPDRPELFRLNLRNTDLRGAVLHGAHLEAADLTGAHLEGATLDGAHLEHATLGAAYLRYTTLSEAHLEHADLGGTHLEHAILSEAYLRGADLRFANLKAADLTGAHLEDTDLTIPNQPSAYLGGRTHNHSLTVDQLVAARPFKNTRLPADLAADRRVMARVAEVETDQPDGLPK
ncbi:uncharacterized protein YjbI with pentapeptide repeats [Kitasatospora sp. MAP12-15]|uniref:pentapeptide repeat-containing protein n=1 Tax=unclassified Kitasatospora TaxID=2633591 RepID=UPI002473D665|nr:pentapeptide repeat-containing protein [Kitasatospora sp. MAP12-44]MDH6115661.1 uncharacterized protein YjbI with pentapeptide repeats [Kitasatospora sp. MAP12-44]